MASSLLLPQNSGSGVNPPQTRGLSFFPNSSHLKSSVKWAQGTPAGLPSGIFGIGDDMEGAIQQAAHPTLHSIFFLQK